MIYRYIYICVFYSNSLAYLCSCFPHYYYYLLQQVQLSLSVALRWIPEIADFGNFVIHCILCSVLSTHYLILRVFRNNNEWTCGEEEITGEEEGVNEDMTARTGPAKTLIDKPANL